MILVIYGILVLCKETALGAFKCALAEMPALVLDVICLPVFIALGGLVLAESVQILALRVAACMFHTAR